MQLARLMKELIIAVLLLSARFQCKAKSVVAVAHDMSLVNGVESLDSRLI